MDNGTQVKDIAKKEDYPTFKSGIKLKLKENITTPVSLPIDGKVDRGLSQVITNNMKAESQAIGDYNQLLNYDGLSDTDKEKIQEFISDEKNHLAGLQEMLTHYDGNIETKKD